jgi:hypothetical protein
VEGRRKHYLDSVRSIAQSRIALRRKPQCTRSYIRIMIMKTVVNAGNLCWYIRDEQSDGDEAGHRGQSLPNPDCDALSPIIPLIPLNNRRGSNNKMRQIRSKAYRKLMAMYSTSFGFRQPYQVLGAFCASQLAAAAALARENRNPFLLTYPPPLTALVILSLLSGL